MNPKDFKISWSQPYSLGIVTQRLADEIEDVLIEAQLECEDLTEANAVIAMIKGKM